MLRDLLTQKCAQKKGNLFWIPQSMYIPKKPNRQISFGPPSTNFFQNVIFTSLFYCIRSKTVSNMFHCTGAKRENWSIFANFSHIL
jgi:hypothetical protein